MEAAAVRLYCARVMHFSTFHYNWGERERVPAWEFNAPPVCLSVYIISGAFEGRSVQLRGTAFESERLRHFPFMDIFSSGA